MLPLICHLVGDYCLQNQAMANRKTWSWGWAATHVMFYMIPFWLVFDLTWPAVAVMAGTHLIIDRFRLARYWCLFWGIGCPGFVGEVCAAGFRDLPIMRTGADRTDPDQWVPPVQAPPTPDYLVVWLLIIVDNTAHLAINYAALAGLVG